MRDWMSYYENYGMIAPYEGHFHISALFWSVLYSIFAYCLIGRFSFLETFTTICLTGCCLQWMTFGNSDINSIMIIFKTLPLFLTETILLVSAVYSFRIWEYNYIKDKYMITSEIN